jgi:hypothetical protein
MAKDLVHELKEDNKCLNEILKDKSIHYLGTDPVKDAKKLHREAIKKIAMNKVDKGGELIVKGGKNNCFEAYGHGIQ